MRNEKDLTFDEFIAAVRNEDIRRSQIQLKPEESDSQVYENESLVRVNVDLGTNSYSIPI